MESKMRWHFLNINGLSSFHTNQPVFYISYLCGLLCWVYLVFNPHVSYSNVQNYFSQCLFRFANVVFTPCGFAHALLPLTQVPPIEVISYGKTENLFISPDSCSPFIWGNCNLQKCKMNKMYILYPPLDSLIVSILPLLLSLSLCLSSTVSFCLSLILCWSLCFCLSVSICLSPDTHTRVLDWASENLS